MDGAIIEFDIRDEKNFERLATIIAAISEDTFPWDDEQAQREYLPDHLPVSETGGSAVQLPRGLLDRLRETKRECDFICCGRGPGQIGTVATDPYAYPVDSDALRSLIALFGHRAR